MQSRDQLETLREAIAREFEWSKRGTEAYMIHTVSVVVERIRAIDLVVNCSTDSVLDRVFTILKEVKEDPAWQFYPYWDHPSGYYHGWVRRVETLNTNDPMAPFSDRDKWWPLNKAEKVDACVN